MGWFGGRTVEPISEERIRAIVHEEFQRRDWWEEAKAAAAEMKERGWTADYHQPRFPREGEPRAVSACISKGDLVLARASGDNGDHALISAFREAKRLLRLSEHLCRKEEPTTENAASG